MKWLGRMVGVYNQLMYLLPHKDSPAHELQKGEEHIMTLGITPPKRPTMQEEIPYIDQRKTFLSPDWSIRSRVRDLERQQISLGALNPGDDFMKQNKPFQRICSSSLTCPSSFSRSSATLHGRRASAGH